MRGEVIDGMQPTINAVGSWRRSSNTWTRPARRTTVAFAALTGRRRRSGIDDFANEALEQMRRERIRVYTEASGPLYFGRIDGTDGETLYVGRHAVWSADNELLSVNWRAPAAEPFYAATAHDPHGLAAPPAARHRGPHGARLRRRDAGDRRTTTT